MKALESQYLFALNVFLQSTDTSKDNDAEDDNALNNIKRRRLGKNPDVDTSFLPDVDRDEEENKLRQSLRKVSHAGIGIGQDLYDCYALNLGVGGKTAALERGVNPHHFLVLGRFWASS